MFGLWRNGDGMTYLMRGDRIGRRDGRCELEWNHKDRDSGLPLPLQIIYLANSQFARSGLRGRSEATIRRECGMNDLYLILLFDKDSALSACLDRALPNNGVSLRKTRHAAVLAKTLIG